MFENLEGLELKGTAEYTLFQLEGEPVVHLAPATEANKPYFNALLKCSRKNQARIRAQVFSAAMIKDNRENDRELFPLYVIKGWKNMPGKDGFIEFNEQNCSEFCRKLPDWLFDDVRTFATDPNNFLSMDVVPEDVAGNSR